MSKIPEPPKHLPDRQKLFFLYYLQTLNATQAAISAGFSPKTALKTAYLWVGEHRDKCPKYYKSLWDAVHDAKLDKIKIIHLNAERVLKEIMSVAFFNHKDMLDPETGIPLLLADLPEEVLAGLESIKLLKRKVTSGSSSEEEINLVEYRTHPKMKALEFLAKFLQIDPTLNYKKPTQGHGPSENDEIRRVLEKVAGKTRGLPPRTPELPEGYTFNG